jgi:hypothetical protein
MYQSFHKRNKDFGAVHCLPLLYTVNVKFQGGSQKICKSHCLRCRTLLKFQMQICMTGLYSVCDHMIQDICLERAQLWQENVVTDNWYLLEVQGVAHLLRAWKVSAADIFHHLLEMYGIFLCDVQATSCQVVPHVCVCERQCGGRQLKWIMKLNNRNQHCMC